MNGWTCLPSLTAPNFNFSLTYESTVEFPFLQTMQILMVSRCCFAEYGWEIYKVSKRTCWAIVLSIRSFVLPRSRCRRRRGLLHSRYTVARSFNAKFAYSYNEIVIAGVLFSATLEFKNAIQSEHVRNTEKLSLYILLFF